MEQMDLISLLVGQSNELPPFSTSWLLPHYPQEQSSVFKSAAVYQKFNEFFDDCEEERAKLAERKAKFLLMLEEKYTSSLAQTSCSREEEAVEPVKVIKDSQEENMSVPSNVTCTEELLAWFQEHYEAFVSGLAQEVEVESLYRWARNTLEVLVNKFQAMEPEGTLAEKFFSVLQDWSASRNGSTLESKDYNEHLLQVLMYLELSSCCDVDSSAVVKKVTEILRKVSVHINPTLPAEFMHEITPFYIGRCRSALLDIFDNMMYSLPLELRSTSSPSCSYIQPLVEQEESKSDTEEPRVSEECNSVGDVKKRLVRHRSFQEQSLTRQIMIPQKKKKKSGQKSKNGIKKSKKSPSHLFKVRPEAGRSGQLLRKSACRRLFSRSHTVASIDQSKCSDHEENETNLPNGSTEGDDRLVLVKETPVKKQVEDYHKFKLERLRSKSSVSASQEVLVVEESPRRSFYSARKLTRLTPNFKTPPLNDGKSNQYSPSIILNKDPSPAAIHSLLHDKFISPSFHSSIVTSPLTITVNQQSHTSSSPSSNLAVAQDKLQNADDILSSEEMFKPCSTEKRSSSQGFRSARMLTYGEAATTAERPFEPATAESATTPVKSKRFGTRAFRSPKKSLTPTNTRTRTPIRQAYRTKSVPSTPVQSFESPRTPAKADLAALSGSCTTPELFPGSACRTPTKYNRTPSKRRGTPLRLRRRLVCHTTTPTKTNKD